MKRDEVKRNDDLLLHRLERLYKFLDEEGQYVHANTVYLAQEEIKEAIRYRDTAKVRH